MLDKTDERERPTLRGARQALFRGDFELCLTLCDALDGSAVNGLEADFLRSRAYIAIGQAERALETLRRVRVKSEQHDEALTIRMLEGAALARLSRLDTALEVLAAAHTDAACAHSTIRAEAALHLGAVHYRRGRYDRALEFLASVPPDADIIRVRATVFEAWVAFERAETATAVERFRAALQQLNEARHYDRFVEASAMYGLAFLCAELPRIDLWPELRRRAHRFDWSAPGVVVPQFYLAIAASYITEMRGEFDEADRWTSRAQVVAPGPAHEILALLRLAALTGRYGEARAHAHFIRAAQRRYDAAGASVLVREDPGLPLALAEEIAYGPNPSDARAILTFHREVTRPRVEHTKDEPPLAAADAFVRGLVEDASGRRSRALEHLQAAFTRYETMGYRRRAAIAAYRVALLDGSADHRAYLQRIASELHPAFWLSERLASFGLRDVRLTERQIAVLRLLAAGKSNKAIASDRGGSWYTARNVVRELITAFGVRNRSELVRVAIARGILPPPEDASVVR